jgi:hypothetical protein
MHDEHTELGNGRVSLREPADRWTTSSSRMGFLKGMAAAGAGVVGLGALTPGAVLAGARKASGGLTAGDLAILEAAEIAEALAVTTYSNIINTAPFFKHLPSDDQGYLKAALQEEMSHYLLEQSVTGKGTAYTTFYYPANMFSDAQTTLNILVTLEDAFIAAYLIGVRDFSTADLRVTAARIMGIESDHRTLARVVGPDVASRDGGPITKITGIQKSAEPAAPPNNNGYERTLSLTNISQAVTALLPFVDASAAGKAGFNAKKGYKFAPFTPTLPNPLGAFHSYNG